MTSLSICHLELVVWDGNLVKILLKSKKMRQILNWLSPCSCRSLPAVFAISTYHRCPKTSLSHPTMLRQTCFPSVRLSSRMVSLWVWDDWPLYRTHLLRLTLRTFCMCWPVNHNMPYGDKSNHRLFDT